MKHKLLERIEFPFMAWTDYPLKKSEYEKAAPVRQVMVLNYDGNKYCTVLYKHKKYEIKAGYIYEYPNYL